MSLEQKKYLNKLKREKILVSVTQIFIITVFFITWELLARYKIINTFIFSSPQGIINTVMNLIKQNNLLIHILTTLEEITIAFILGIILGFSIAILLYSFKFLARVLDPFLTMLNSLPKVALGPILIIWTGANMKSIIVMALLINLIISIITIYNGFLGTDKTKIKLLTTFGATKLQVLIHVVIPSSYTTIISSLKLNISMSLIGVIMGEFLVSKKGIGYLIIYGTQIFNLNLVITGIFILIIISYLLYKLIIKLEIQLTK